MADPAHFEPVLLLEDEPVPGFRVDELSLVPFAKVIAGAADGTGGPFTIGVFAEWGEGKTSVLRQAKTLLDDQRPEVVTVWFNAWQYEKEEHPIVPLVATIVHAIDLKLATLKAKRTRKALLDSLAKVGRSLRAIAYGFSAKTKVAVPGFAEIEAGFVAKEMIERYEKLEGRDDPLIQRTLYYHAFETLQAATTAKPDQRPKIVVFVDDLDRCLPPNGLKLLESLKLVLCQPGFIFVLAVDRRIIEGYLVKRYRDDFGIADYEEGGKSYLDKIVQLPLPLPPHRSRFQRYVEKLLERPTFQGANEPVRQALKQLVGVLAVGSDHNPRSLVRFINNLIIDRNLWIAVRQQAGEPAEVDADLLGLCAVSRILRHQLGDPLYNFLVGSKTACESLARDEQEPGKRAPAGPPGEASPAEESTRKLERRLAELPFLNELLKTDPGQSWLLEHDRRKSVHEFLVTERKETREEVRSSEAIIERAIRRQLNKPDGVITEEDRRSVSQLDFMETQVSDLTPLAALSGLQELDLYDTPVSDVRPLAELRGLQSLVLSYTQVSDLRPLAKVSSLRVLYLSYTPVSDLTPLAELSGLQELNLMSTQVSDLMPLAELRGLQSLDLRNTQVSDLTPLAVLSGLELLDLSSTQVSDLTPLADLSGLRALLLRNTQVSEEQIGELQRTLPGCEVFR